MDFKKHRFFSWRVMLKLFFFSFHGPPDVKRGRIGRPRCGPLSVSSEKKLGQEDADHECGCFSLVLFTHCRMKRYKPLGRMPKRSKMTFWRIPTCLPVTSLNYMHRNLSTRMRMFELLLQTFWAEKTLVKSLLISP
jgi:hypothetical protein